MLGIVLVVLVKTIKVKKTPSISCKRSYFSEELLKECHTLRAWILKLDLILPTVCVALGNLFHSFHSPFIHLWNWYDNVTYFIDVSRGLNEIMLERPQQNAWHIGITQYRKLLF